MSNEISPLVNQNGRLSRRRLQRSLLIKRLTKRETYARKWELMSHYLWPLLQRQGRLVARIPAIETRKLLLPLKCENVKGVKMENSFSRFRRDTHSSHDWSSSSYAVTPSSDSPFLYAAVQLVQCRHSESAAINVSRYFHTHTHPCKEKKLKNRKNVFPIPKWKEFGR